MISGLKCCDCGGVMAATEKAVNVALRIDRADKEGASQFVRVSEPIIRGQPGAPQPCR